jgi:hypothetical protein
VNPEGGKVSVYVAGNSSPLRHENEQLTIPTCAILCVESWRPLERCGSKKCRLLKPARSTIEITPHSEVSGSYVAQLPALGINYISVSQGHIAFRIRLEKLFHPPQRTRKKEVIGIQKSEDLAIRPCKPLIQPVRCPSVRFEDDLRNLLAITPDQFATTIRRTWIYDNIFQIMIVLMQNRVYRLGKKVALVIGQGNDAYFHAVICNLLRAIC